MLKLFGMSLVMVGTKYELAPDHVESATGSERVSARIVYHWRSAVYEHHRILVVESTSATSSVKVDAE